MFVIYRGFVIQRGSLYWGFIIPSVYRIWFYSHIYLSWSINFALHQYCVIKDIWKPAKLTMSSKFISAVFNPRQICNEFIWNATYYKALCMPLQYFFFSPSSGILKYHMFIMNHSRLEPFIWCDYIIWQSIENFLL